MNDELFERLNAIDPHPESAPVSPHDGPVARTLMESIMNTPAHPPTSTVAPTARPRRTGLIAGGIAAAVAAGVAVVIGVGGLGTTTTDEPVPDTTPVTTPATTPDTAPGTAPGTSITVALAATDPMAMCLQMSDHIPDPTAAAFGGTVVAVADGTVTVTVDRWFQNGDADQVVITVSDTGMVETGIEGTALVEGAELLVTVVDGNVQTCGISAGASPELLAFYETWYG